LLAILQKPTARLCCGVALQIILHFLSRTIAGKLADPKFVFGLDIDFLF